MKPGVRRCLKRVAAFSPLLALVALECSGEKATIMLFDDPALGGGTSGVDASGAAAGAAGGGGAPQPDVNPGGTSGTSGADAGNVECTSDGQCATRRCSATNTCVRCSRDLDCGPTFPFCDDDGRCQECRTGADCPPGQVCSAEPRVCVARCSSDGDCAGGDRPICAVSSGFCVECTVATDCKTEKPACDTRTGSCFRCLTNADCDGGYCSVLEHEGEYHFSE